MRASSFDIAPTFYLYGEPHRHVDEHFVHVENLDDRSRPSEWTIQPHAHAALNHVFHIREGGGALQVEATILTFDAPCLIVVPAGLVHGFSWRSESSGAVVTVSSTHLDRLVQTDVVLAGIFTNARVTALSEPASRRFVEVIRQLMQELGWGAPGHRAAGEACLLDLFVRILRAGTTSAIAAGPGEIRAAEASLVARFRERVETRFRLREPMATYVAALGTSENRLRSACRYIARRSPLQILDQRALLEAQRALLYSNLSIAEVATSIGFDDAAYFSRFFHRNIGKAPKAFREQTPRAATALTQPDSG